MSAVISEGKDDNVTEFRSPGPGERLRSARLALGYDLAKVAGELHLTSHVVDALERDVYDDIGARVFVRGYLKNYARVVNLPTESITRQFDELWPDDHAAVSVHERPSLPGDVRPGSSWVRLVSWLILLGVVALFGMWWWGYLDAYAPGRPGAAPGAGLVTDNNSPVEAIVEEDNAPALVADDGTLLLPALPSLPNQADPDGVSPVGQAPGSDVQAEAAPSADASTPDIVEAMSAVTGPESVTALPEDTASTVTPGVSAALADATPAAAASPSPVGALAIPAPAGTAAEAPSAAAPESRSAPVAEPVGSAEQGIVFSFSASCWVDIRDSSRTFKLFGEMAKGTRKVLGGTPPYKVVLGNAKAVTVAVNGEPFDISPHARGNVARFTLDP